jgi:hypothetical protein
MIIGMQKWILWVGMPAVALSASLVSCQPVKEYQKNRIK